MEEHKEEQPEMQEDIEKIEGSPTGGELPRKLEEQPTQMFIAKKRDEVKQEETKRNWKAKLKDFFRECKRVLKITKKPDKVELKTIVKISGLGILVIGLIGFLIHIVKELLITKPF
jgi:protein transport protein SEC61 subunit gamma-like protein